MKPFLFFALLIYASCTNVPKQIEAINKETQTKGFKQVINDSDKVEITPKQVEGADKITSIKGNCRTRDDIVNVVQNRGSKMKYCYDVGLKHDPDLQGKVYVKFKIDPNGNIVSVEIVSTTCESTYLEECLIKYIPEWKFNAVEGCNTIVTYPFTFSVSDIKGE